MGSILDKLVGKRILGFSITEKIARLIVIAGIAIGLLLVFSVVSRCVGGKTADKQAEVAKEQGQASVGAGQEAMNTVANVAANQAAADAAVASGQSEVRAAPEAEKGRVTVSAACRFKVNANKPECQSK